MGRDLIALFVAKSRGVFGTTLFLGSRAAPADGQVVVVTDTPGLAPGFVQDRGAPAIRRPRAQVVVMGPDVVAVETLAEQLYQDVHTVAGETVGSAHYLRMTAQEPFDLGTEEGSGRVRRGFNVQGLRT